MCCYFVAPCVAFPVAGAALITSFRREVPVIEVLQERGEAGEEGEEDEAGEVDREGRRTVMEEAEGRGREEVDERGIELGK